MIDLKSLLDTMHLSMVNSSIYPLRNNGHPCSSRILADNGQGSLETKLEGFCKAVIEYQMPEKSFLYHTKMLQFVSALLKGLLIRSVFPCINT